jgi:hypothetical protein
MFSEEALGGGNFNFTDMAVIARCHQDGGRAARVATAVAPASPSTALRGFLQPRYRGQQEILHVCSVAFGLEPGGQVLGGVTMLVVCLLRLEGMRFLIYIDDGCVITSGLARK